MTTEGRELEERRAGSEEPAASAAIPAIYLIEREAIRLRRLRWTQLETAVPSSAPARAASPAPAASAAEPSAQMDSPQAQGKLLETYARPRADADSAPVTRTFGGKIKRFFGFRGKGKP
jgi:hypothetical protein